MQIKGALAARRGAPCCLRRLCHNLLVPTPMVTAFLTSNVTNPFTVVS